MPISHFAKCDHHFLDSGAFSIQMKAKKWAKQKGKTLKDYYDSKEFYNYMDMYAIFVKRYSYGIDFYANLDVIPDPELSYRNLKYLEEKHGINPVPVVHFGTSMDWLFMYMEKYDFIGLGGLVGKTRKDKCMEWVDKCFDIICNQPGRLPKVKIHGFGVTIYNMLIRYPWFSVDSTSWTKIGGFGGILVPHKRGNNFVYDVQPYTLKISAESPTAKTSKYHYFNLRPKEKAIVDEWLGLIKMPLGIWDKEKGCVEPGVTSFHGMRKKACILFFERMRNSLPDYPWPFYTSRPFGFGI